MTKSCKSCHGGRGAANPRHGQDAKVVEALKSAEVQKLSPPLISRKSITEGKGQMKTVKSLRRRPRQRRRLRQDAQ